ncbi:glycoside hydrolase family 6 protein [Hypoxylon sp. CI-4A]|nr:glycoside hydrolase family 6 protein [Hypoxylon sp. CI-4A]
MRSQMNLAEAIALAALVSAVHKGDAKPTVGTPFSSCETPAVLDAETNVWKDHTLFANPYYREEVNSAVEAISDAELRTKASKVANVGTFIWIKTSDDIPNLAEIANTVPCDNILGLVLDGLPYKGPSAQDEEIEDETLLARQTFYIDATVEIMKTSPNTSFAVIVEPRAFPRYFNDTGTNQDLAKNYRENVPYALKELNLPNVMTYIDVGNSNSMDWERQRDVAAKEIIDIYEAAESPSQFRGFATNVASFNSWDLLPGEFTPADDSPYPRPQNEQHFARILSNTLRENGLPSRATHAILDSSRNGISGLRESWDDWCNVKGAGLGPRPTAETGDDTDTLDAFVWAKHPGESDGASDPSSAGYDEFCAKDDALTPSPEAGQWFQAHFEVLVRNADPSL